MKKDLRDMLQYNKEEHLMMSIVELRKRAAARRIFENMVDYRRIKHYAYSPQIH